MYLADTNILIAYFEGDVEIVILLDKWMKDRQLQLSCIVVAEFLVRAKADEQKALWRLEEQSSVVFLDKQILIKAVEIRKRLLAKKKRVVMLDCFIAATVMVNGWTFITRDARDFKSVSGLQLKVI